VVSPLVPLLLAAAVVCAPGPTARARLAALWPAPAARHRWRPRLAAPVLLGGLAGMLVAGIGGALSGVVVTFIAVRKGRARRADGIAAACAEQLAEALHRINDELRAGSHPSAALGGASTDGPHARQALGPAAAAARLGDDVPAALRRTATDQPAMAAPLERMAAAWSLADRHGIPLAELLAGVQADIRWQVRFGSTVRAQLAGPRATAAVLTALPALGLALGQLIGADPVSVLRGGVLGQVLLVVGVALAAAGSAWSERILRSAVPR
jgi:tight adherence protein B